MQSARWVFHAALAVILLAPSVWMIATIPPLWRDVDAYNQLTVQPASATALGHGPLYCYAARVPLWLGAQIDRLGGGVSTSAHVALGPPVLTNAGILLLILMQHAGFVAASFFFITTVSAVPWVRLAAGLLWSGLHPFYTFSHCVGSETLSMICVLVFAALGWKIARRARTPRSDWIWFGIAMFACVASRHVNLWLAIALPLTFLLRASTDALHSLRRRVRDARRRRLLAHWNLRRALFSLALGVLCILLVKLTSFTVCRLAHQELHSHLGTAFLWRLQFLEQLSPAERNQLLDRVAQRAATPEVLRLVNLLRETIDRGDKLRYGPFATEAEQALFSPSTKRRRAKLSEPLNAMARAFLVPPQPELWTAAGKDFSRARKVTLPAISRFLFATTAYFFDHPGQMAQAAMLETFRDRDAPAIMALPLAHRYFQLGRKLDYNVTFLFWMVALAAAAFLPRRNKAERRARMSLALSLTATGIFMMMSTCLIGELLPRYTLPMWELLLASLFLLVVGSLDALVVCKTERSLH